MTKVWLWWSTGKDSAWTLQRLEADPDVEVERLVTTATPEFGRVSIHGTRMEVLRAQADAAGVPLEVVELPYPCSNEEYEAAVAPVVHRAEDASVDHMAFGDLFLEDVRDYRERLLAGSSVTPLFPIWGEDTRRLAAALLAAGVEAYVVSLDPRVVDRDLIGVRYDEDFLRRLPAGVDPCGENGEFHTCLSAGPMLSERLELVRGEVVERNGFVYADFMMAPQ